MARACKDCGGKGQWQERVEDADGMVNIEQKICGTCKGRGRVITDDDDLDDFDLAGVGVTEDDEIDDDD